MRAGIWTALWTFVAIAGVFGEAQAWPTSSGGGMPIAEARENADTGDYFSIEGIVVSNSQNRFFTIQDRSGEMVVVIPEYITREQGVPKNNERVRVSGKYDQKKLDTSVKGMRVIRLHRFGSMGGAKGDPSPSLAPIRSTETSPAAPWRESGATVFRPTAPAELKERMRAKRIEFGVAKKEVEAAASIYADALYAAGDGPVDPAVQDRLEQAEARMGEIVDSLPPLLDEARAAGISDDLISLYKQSAGMSR